MPVSRALAPSRALPLRDLRVLAADGLVTRVIGDVYVDAHAERNADVRADVVATASEPDDVIGRDTAVWVHTGLLYSPLIHVLVPAGRRHRRFRNGFSVHESAVAATDITTVGRLRLTNLYRSVFDVCATRPESTEQRLDAVCGYVDPDGFAAYVAGLRMIPGKRRVLAALQDRIG